MYLVALLLTFFQPLAAQPDRFGVPACSGSDQELAVRSSFVLCYDSSLKVPVWAAYEMKGRENGSAARPKHFRHDGELAGPSAYDADYRNSGFARGHMVPAADLGWSESGLRDTFLLSNVVPQKQEVNGGKWKQVENAVRRLAEGSEVYVFTGPVFDCGQVERFGRSQVAVPCKTFKVVLVIRGGSKTMYAAIVPNSSVVPGPLDEYAVSVAEVEQRTGLNFFSALDDAEQRQLESVRRGLPARATRLTR